jgi:hypothetical protein
MTEEEKVVERIATVAQSCIQQHPVVFWGSGDHSNPNVHVVF